ncbi:MAG: signal peptidase II [Candidatus Promineifilaceae bacterium]|nr:signal peptidase II [Candidatus Promineifilaceae bacterium]
MVEKYPEADEKREPIESPATLDEKALLFLMMALIVIVDQITKMWIEIWLPLNRSWAPVDSLAPFFKFTHISNTGAAFGLFPAGSNFFVMVAIAVTLFIVAYNYVLPANNHLFRLALGLQLGGALGNLIDRFRLGHVTDFLDFGPWPVFNVADMSIVAGVILLGYLLLMEERRQLNSEDEGTEEGSSETLRQDSSMLWND